MRRIASEPERGSHANAALELDAARHGRAELRDAGRAGDRGRRSRRRVRGVDAPAEAQGQLRVGRAPPGSGRSSTARSTSVELRGRAADRSTMRSPNRWCGSFISLAPPLTSRLPDAALDAGVEPGVADVRPPPRDRLDVDAELDAVRLPLERVGEGQRQHARERRLLAAQVVEAGARRRSRRATAAAAAARGSRPRSRSALSASKSSLPRSAARRSAPSTSRSSSKRVGRRTARETAPQSTWLRGISSRARTLGCTSPPLNALCSYFTPAVRNALPGTSAISSWTNTLATG